LAVPEAGSSSAPGDHHGEQASELGYDGTVIQSVTPTRLYNTDEFDCRWEWWPGFFH